MIDKSGVGGMIIYTGKNSDFPNFQLTETAQPRHGTANKHHFWTFSNTVFENVNLKLRLLTFYVTVH
jgi:hypothetical protein